MYVNLFQNRTQKRNALKMNQGYLLIIAFVLGSVLGTFIVENRLTSLVYYNISLKLVTDVDAFNFCSSSKMWNAYSEMRRANCRNCDKYVPSQSQ